MICYFSALFEGNNCIFTINVVNTEHLIVKLGVISKCELRHVFPFLIPVHWKQKLHFSVSSKYRVRHSRAACRSVVVIENPGSTLNPCSTFTHSSGGLHDTTRRRLHPDVTQRLCCGQQCLSVAQRRKELRADAAQTLSHIQEQDRAAAGRTVFNVTSFRQWSI